MLPNLLIYGQKVQKPLNLVTGVKAEAPDAVEMANRVDKLMGHACECLKQS